MVFSQFDKLAVNEHYRCKGNAGSPAHKMAYFIPYFLWHTQQKNVKVLGWDQILGQKLVDLPKFKC
jgi:hypothetical protein